MSENTRWFHDLTTDEAKEERQTLAQRVIAWLGVVCLLVLIGIATNAHSETVVPVHVIDHHEGVKMRLLPTPCVDTVSLGIIMQGPEQFQPRFKAISSQWRDKEGKWSEFGGCWLMVKKEEVGAPDDIFVLIFSDGAVVQVFAKELLKKAGPSV